MNTMTIIILPYPVVQKLQMELVPNEARNTSINVNRLLNRIAIYFVCYYADSSLVKLARLPQQIRYICPVGLCMCHLCFKTPASQKVLTFVNITPSKKKILTCNPVTFNTKSPNLCPMFWQVSIFVGITQFFTFTYHNIIIIIIITHI